MHEFAGSISILYGHYLNHAYIVVVEAFPDHY